MQSASALEGGDIINANATPAVIVGLRTRDICDKPMAHILSLPEQRACSGARSFGVLFPLGSPKRTAIHGGNASRVSYQSRRRYNFTFSRMITYIFSAIFPLSGDRLLTIFSISLIALAINEDLTPKISDPNLTQYVIFASALAAG
jgi:hypothetical protein